MDLYRTRPKPTKPNEQPETEAFLRTQPAATTTMNPTIVPAFTMATAKAANAQAAYSKHRTRSTSKAANMRMATAAV